MLPPDEEYLEPVKKGSSPPPPQPPRRSHSASHLLQQQQIYESPPKERRDAPRTRQSSYSDYEDEKDHRKGGFTRSYRHSERELSRSRPQDMRRSTMNSRASSRSLRFADEVPGNRRRSGSFGSLHSMGRRPPRRNNSFGDLLLGSSESRQRGRE